MEDYDIFNEMQNIKKIIMIVEDDEEFILKKLFKLNIEIMPIRFSYDLSVFLNGYIDKTKELFTFYFNENNSFENELLRLKKHFVHYQRMPVVAYIPNDEKYLKLNEILKSVGIKCVSTKEQLLEIINNKIIFIDSDGTLRKTDGTISKKVKDVILKHKKIGNMIIICTSRPRYHTLEVMKMSGADSIVISSNGSEIYDVDNNKVIFSSFIDKEEVIKLVKYAYDRDVRLILTLEDYEYVTKCVRNSNQRLLNKDNYFDELNNCDVKQCMFIDNNGSQILQLRDILSKCNKLNIVDECNNYDSGEEKWFSVGSFNSSKGNAILFLTKYLDVSIKNVISIGNDKNDVSMFDVSSFSVAVANASDEIKNKVDYVTLSNDEDGVALFLESLL